MKRREGKDEERRRKVLRGGGRNEGAECREGQRGKILKGPKGRGRSAGEEGEEGEATTRSSEGTWKTAENIPIYGKYWKLTTH